MREHESLKLTSKHGVTQKGDTRGLNKVIKESIIVGNVHTGCCLTIKESITLTIYYWGTLVKISVDFDIFCFGHIFFGCLSE